MVVCKKNFWRRKFVRREIFQNVEVGEEGRFVTFNSYVVSEPRTPGVLKQGPAFLSMNPLQAIIEHQAKGIPYPGANRIRGYPLVMGNENSEKTR